MSALYSVISQIVGHENIKKVGSQFRTYSVFNPEERTPSFFFNDTVWKDFSVDKGGNVVDLVMEFFGKTRDEALEYLEKNFKAEDFNFVRKPKSYKTFNEEHLAYQLEAKKVDMNKYFYELFDKDFIASLDSQRVAEVARKHLGYSKKHDSLTISLFNGSDVVQIKTRRTNWGKWIGEKGSNGNFIVYKIKKNEPLVFLVSGMAEIMLCEMMDLPYVGLQSDGAIKHLDYRRLKGLDVVVLEDCDAEEFLEVSKFYYRVTEKIDKTKVKRVMFFDFRNILDRPLPKGYDFRDFCNEVKSYEEVIRLFKDELVLCRRVADDRY